MKKQFKTTAVYISGAICGKMWMPSAMAGAPLKMNARGPFGFADKGDSFQEMFGSLLMKKGGDFQRPLFTADTVLCVERRRISAPGKYEVHVREFPIAKLAHCADLVDAESHTEDFIGEE
jgi:hypothetical protein